MSPKETVWIFLCFTFAYMATVVLQCIDVENVNPLRLSSAVCQLEIGIRSEGKQKKSLNFGWAVPLMSKHQALLSHTMGPCLVMMLHICSEEAAVMDY